MDKQNKYSARPQGFRGNYRPVPQAVKEETPDKKKRRVKKAVPKKAKINNRRRKRTSIRKWLLPVAAALIFMLIAGVIIRAVVINANKTVHMLPEIYDIATPEPDAGLFAPAGTQETAGENFIAEGSGA